MQYLAAHMMHTDPRLVERLGFCEKAKFDTFCEKRDFALNLSGTDFIDNAVRYASHDGVYKTHVVSCAPGETSLYVGDMALIQIGVGGTGFGPEIARHNFEVYAIGERQYVLDFFAALRNHYGDARLATVTWWFETQHGADARTVPIEPPLPLFDELYPWIEGGVEEYLTRFLDDGASILFMMGPPGTGKTSLLRHMVYTRKLAATITYEEKLLGTDQIFVNFLTGTDDAILVIEDADLMVGNRESEGNKLISRFLNVSDGLIKTSGKKIVFTTNLGDFRHVDKALVRAGRCFDAIKFRPLTQAEATAAAAVAKIPDPGREVTLAELFGAPRSAGLELAEVGF